MRAIKMRPLDWTELTPYELWTSAIHQFFEISYEDGSKNIESFCSWDKRLQQLKDEVKK